MSFAEDEMFSAYDIDDFAKYAIQRKVVLESTLDTYKHQDKEGNEIDVRTISTRYANNLVNWYRRLTEKVNEELIKFGSAELIITPEEFENKLMIKKLKEIGKYEEETNV